MRKWRLIVYLHSPPPKKNLFIYLMEDITSRIKWLNEVTWSDKEVVWIKSTIEDEKEVL